MSKRQRREHKKQTTRRQKMGKRAAMALAGAAAIAAGTQAYADPIRFDNPPGPGHFVWAVEGWPGGCLDIMLPAEQQPGAPESNSVFPHFTYGDEYGLVTGRTQVIEVELGPSWFRDFLVGVNAGELIPSGAPIEWSEGSAYVCYYSPYSLLPEGEQTYLGVHINLGAGGLQYGWIGVVRSASALDAFAWGYETVPGVPIPAGIPEPGTLALLALGAVGVTARRRRA